MRDTLESKIKHIDRQIETKDPTALEAAIKLAESHPENPDVWRTLAYAHECRDDYASAIVTITRALELVPGEPAWLFARGGYRLMASDYERAIADFSEGLIVCDELNNDYYRGAFHFLRAEAFVQLGRKAEARADLAHVEEGMVFWTIQVRRKAELVALCAD